MQEQMMDLRTGTQFPAVNEMMTHGTLIENEDKGNQDAPQTPTKTPKPVETLFGRLGRNPKVKMTKNNNLVCDFSIAVDVVGSTKPRWVNVNVWGHQGKRLATELKKGDPIFVAGRIETNEYEDRAGFIRVSEQITSKFIGKAI